MQLISCPSLVNLLKLDLPHSTIKLYPNPLLGFVGEQVHTRRYIDLPNTFGTSATYRTLTVRYILVEANTSYIVLIGRQTLNQLGIDVSTPHMTMKFSTENDSYYYENKPKDNLGMLRT